MEEPSLKNMVPARGPEWGNQDVLEQGDDRPRRPALGLAGLGALLLAGGALAGYQAQGWLTERAETGVEEPALVAGTMEQDPRLTSDGFVLPIYNGSDHGVDILEVELHGLNATSEKATIAPGSWVDVAIDLSVDCEPTPYPGREIIVRASSGDGEVEQTLRMPGLPSVLTEEVDRLCGDVTGRPPTLRTLAGVWLVERASRFAGEMLVELNPNHTFAVDHETGLFTDPGIFGTFILHGHWLTLDAVGGRDCEAGGRGVFYATLLPDGRLNVQNISDYLDRWCGIDASDVWIAKRVGAVPPAHTEPADTEPADTRRAGTAPSPGTPDLPGEDATARPGHP